MTTFTVPPNTRSVGTGDPPADVNTLINIVGALLGVAVDGTGTVTTGAVPLTPNSLTVSGVTGATSTPVNVQGSSNAGQLMFVKQTGTTDHAATVYLAGVGGTSQSALNVVSDNTAFSCLEVTGTELNRGTVKIAHHGQADGSDASAAGVSIDLQTTAGGSTGTAAQGFFITSTTDTVPAGNAITVRFNSQDWFVVKGNVGTGNGIVGIGVATNHTPAGMLEITQKDTTTVGLYMTALASGTDMFQFKDSSGNLRLQLNNAGNLITRATTLLSTTVQIGSATTNIGGGGSGCVGITPTGTVPTSNPTGFGVILYVDSTGHLKCLGSAGTTTTIAGP